MSIVAQPIPKEASSRAETLRRLAAAVLSSAGALEAAAEALLVVADEPEASSPVPDEMLTVTEAARELKRSPAYIREQCRRGAIKALQEGRHYRIRRSALTVYERRRTQ